MRLRQWKRYGAREERKRRAHMRRYSGDHRRWAREGVAALAQSVALRACLPLFQMLWPGGN